MKIFKQAQRFTGFAIGAVLSLNASQVLAGRGMSEQQCLDQLSNRAITKKGYTPDSNQASNTKVSGIITDCHGNEFPKKVVTKERYCYNFDLTGDAVGDWRPREGKTTTLKFAKAEASSRRYNGKQCYSTVYLTKKKIDYYGPYTYAGGFMGLGEDKVMVNIKFSEEMKHNVKVSYKRIPGSSEPVLVETLGEICTWDYRDVIRRDALTKLVNCRPIKGDEEDYTKQNILDSLAGNSEPGAGDDEDATDPKDKSGET